MPLIHKYPLPPFLEGTCTVSKYDKWLTNKADTLRKRDLRLGRPYATECTKSVYKGKIHDAILRNGLNDPYTGEALRWDLIGKWDNTPCAAGSVCGRYGALSSEFYLLPTVDHSDPYSGELEFEICSWLVNTSKNLMRPDEYVALCRKVAAHDGKLQP